MNGFLWFSKLFSPRDKGILEIAGRKTYVITSDNKTKTIEIVLIPTLSISKINDLNYTITFAFLCWSFSFTYWKIKWMKNQLK